MPNLTKIDKSFSGRGRIVKPFGIHVVDDTTGRGVPLVELRTTSEVRYYTDSAGWIAFEDAGWRGKKLWFSITSHGYEASADGFGYRGVVLTPESGKTVTLKLKRLNIAERLYRLTGEGIYRDSLLLGLPVALKEPLLNSRVMGQDSVLTVRYKGKIYWFWGDTARPEYPLGHFGTAGAVSSLTDNPDTAINLTYFTDASGFSRPMLLIEKPGAVWVTGVAVIEEGTKLICYYMRMKSLGECVERGLALFDDAKGVFIPVAPFDPAKPSPLSGHPFLATAEGKPYLVGTRVGHDPLPCVRVAPTVAALKDLSAYEVFTPEGWRREGEPMKLTLRDAESRKNVAPHGGSVFYNTYKKRWVMIVGESLGKSSNLGEIWYADAPTALGPWDFARKIVTHNRYDFYNPTQHPVLDRGKYLHFEGTYVNTFSGNPETTPRYNYNQILYRLDLSDPRLTLPSPETKTSDPTLTPR